MSQIQRQNQVISRLQNDNIRLREELKKVAVLEEENKELKVQLEKAFLMIEELQRMVFGKKKKGSDSDHHDDHTDTPSSASKVSRDAASYRRPIPSPEEITGNEYHQIDTCPDCKNVLTKQKRLEFFTEDILPMEEWSKALKRVTKRFMTTGYCSSCHKRVSSVDIPKQKVSIGEQIKSLVVFQSVVQQLSYSQICDFAQSVLHLHISQGEIVNMLESQSIQLKPAYVGIQHTISQATAVHLDETGWPTLQGEQGNYAWVAADTQSNTVLYRLGRSRGGGNITALLGESYAGIGITDDYNAYKNAFQLGKHALCWAHPYRKIRDLKDSDALEEDKREHCRKAFAAFASLYQDVRRIHARPFVQKERKTEVKRLSKVFDHCIRPHPNDPHKLQQIKRRLAEQKECYFVCLLHPGIPPDNNTAERSLRHLVIKRKKSFGSQTQKGADILTILYSVVMSLFRSSARDFFSAYSQALKPIGTTLALPVQ
jgi:hypothetical protein